MPWSIECDLDELLSEPIVALLMSSDGVTEHEVRAVIRTAQERLAEAQNAKK